VQAQRNIDRRHNLLDGAHAVNTVHTNIARTADLSSRLFYGGKRPGQLDRRSGKLDAGSDRVLSKILGCVFRRRQKWQGQRLILDILQALQHLGESLGENIEALFQPAPHVFFRVAGGAQLNRSVVQALNARLIRAAAGASRPNLTVPAVRRLALPAACPICGRQVRSVRLEFHRHPFLFALQPAHCSAATPIHRQDVQDARRSHL
jgi:hypothetical protein